MLQSFSDRIRNSRWLGYLIVGLISVPFALWGIQSYVGGGSTDEAAEVNGERIAVRQVQQMASQQRQQLREEFGGELPEGFSERLFREQALEQLIQRELLRQAAADSGFHVTDDTLRRNIRQQEMFRRDGSFDRELYRQLLSQAGLTPQQYEADVRAGYRIEQLRRGVVDTGFVLPGEARESARLMNEERELVLLVHPRSAAESAVELEEEELRSYYEENESDFQSPPQVRVAYIELDMQTLASQVEVSEEELRSEFEDNRQRYAGTEERTAAHILLEIDNDAGEEAEEQTLETARELRARLQEGEDFGELAREHSDDSGSAEQGGRLGRIARGDMTESFEEALFTLDEEGAVSEPVRTRYGYHLIRLLDLHDGETRSFEEVRDQVEKDLKERRAENLFYDRVEVLRNSAYEQPGSLDPAADETGLEIRRSDWFSRSQGEGIAGSEAIRGAAFSEEVREERLNSDLIELGQRRIVVLRVEEDRSARPIPFDEVRDEVEERLRVERTEQALTAWTEETLARLDDGTEPESLADDPVELREPGWVGRMSEELDSVVQETAFGLPAPADGEGLVHAETELDNGDRAVVIVRAARLPEVGNEVIAETRQQQLQTATSAEMRVYLEALREEADIVRNEDALNR